jgi:hypothetical protein
VQRGGTSSLRLEWPLSCFPQDAFAGAANGWNPPSLSSDATGPDLPSIGMADAALQLHETGRSCIAQHFRR